MNVQYVYGTGDERVHVPQLMGFSRPDQLQGTVQECLIELCGRVCYDSLGTEKSRASGPFHLNLVNHKHYSVHEAVHITIETTLPLDPWFGIPDISACLAPEGGKARLTFNLRHAIEWPKCVTCTWWKAEDKDMVELVAHWALLLRNVLRKVAPQLLPALPPLNFNANPIHPYEISEEPQVAGEAFVSLFLEDSRVFSHEMVRHRGNVSQRSGRFVDETDRANCIHPLFRDYLNECGFLNESGEADGMWEGGTIDDQEIVVRTNLGNAVGSLNAQARMVYISLVDALEPYAMQKLGLSALDARKQARSAARYYLGNGLSTEMIFTASIRHWRHIFEMRTPLAADAAIRGVMAEAQEIVLRSRYGKLL